MDPWTYTLFLMPARDPTWTVTCEGVDGPYTHTHGGAAGLSQAFVGAHDDDPEIVRVFDLQSGRMEGSYRVPGKYEKTVRWSICREGVTCPPLERDDPAPPPGANKCSLPRNLRAMLALALAEQQALQPKTDDKSLNELRNKSIEVDQLTEQYRSACLDYANCMEMPSGMCETIPPQTKTAFPKGSKSPRSSPPAGGGGFVRP
jgi:hypothetical protein